MIDRAWQEMVWGDALSLDPGVGRPRFKDLLRQYHDAMLSDSPPWPAVVSSYYRICRFFNAMGFADSIYHATQVVRENPSLVHHTLWIVDEFQDFNAAEEGLLGICTNHADGVLLAGDDDQALYEDLKASHPDIIRSYYRDTGWMNALLPFCSRCSYHICLGAAAFISQSRPAASIRKVFLPLARDEGASRIRLVACTAPSTAVEYVDAFLRDHRRELEGRGEEIREGKAKDPLVLILSPTSKVESFLMKGQGDRLVRLVENWRLESSGAGSDYDRVLIYYAVAQDPTDNFSLRKAFKHEGMSDDDAHRLIAVALTSGLTLSEVDSDAVRALLSKCAALAGFIESEGVTVADKVGAIAELVHVEDAERLAADLASFPMISGAVHGDDDEVEVATGRTVSPVELMSIVVAKGLSADHVLILGCDNVNMSRTSAQAFFVAMTRARSSLHLLVTFGARGAAEPHRFAMALPREHCDYIKCAKAGVSAFRDREEFSHFFAAVRAARVRRVRR
jgi:superfamily I DNA/RNA helicase